ncbi:hypothetical protein EMIT0P258_110007 [Pseudomonas sp. IT-P258]
MDLLTNLPSWDDIERNFDQKFNALNEGVDNGFQSAHDGWNGFTRRVSNGATQAYGYVGGHRIDNVRHAMALSVPIMQMNISRKWASININEILPVLLKLLQEVVMIVGGSVTIGAALGGAVGSFAFGAGAVPGAAIGAGVGLQVGNLIMAALGLYAITGYFSAGIGPCLSTIFEGLCTAWQSGRRLEKSRPRPDWRFSGDDPGTQRTRSQTVGPRARAIGVAATDGNCHLSHPRADESGCGQQPGKYCDEKCQASIRDFQQAVCCMAHEKRKTTFGASGATD